MGFLTFTSALPQNVAPKNCQKGIWKCPQQMPQRSKRALGHAASRKIPQNPCLKTKPVRLRRRIKRVWDENSGKLLAGQQHVGLRTQLPA